MKVHLASVGVPAEQSCIPAFRASAAADRIGVHEVCDDPAAADALVFTECHLIDDWRLRPIFRSSLFRRYPEKAFVYNERDLPWCALPGVYVSMPRHTFDPVRQRSFAYYAVEEPYRKLGVARAPSADPDLLFSLVASPTHRSRSVLFALRHPRAVVESVDAFAFFDPGSRDFDARRRHFAETLYRSKFVLCPRGRGSSSIRLYEALAAGRVPVILSDAWVPPAGPAWDRISVRWPERRVDGLIEHLEELEPRAAAMGLEARAAFEAWFAPDMTFHRIVDLLEECRAVPPHERQPSRCGLRRARRS